MQCPPPGLSLCYYVVEAYLTTNATMWLLHSVYEPEPNFKALLFTWRYNGVDMYPVLPKEWMQKDMKLSMILYDIIQIGTRQITPSEICIILYIVWMLSPIIVLLLIQKKSNVSIDVLSSRLHNLANSNAKWIKGFMPPCPLVFYTLMIKRTFG